MPHRRGDRNGSSIKVQTVIPPGLTNNRTSLSQAPSSHKLGKRHQQHLIADTPAHSVSARPLKRHRNTASAAPKQQKKKLSGIPTTRTPIASLYEPAASEIPVNASGLARLKAVDATAQLLWQEAIAERRPGSAEVLVEQRGGMKEGFGKGRKVHMTFGQLIDQLYQSSDLLYLTTQQAELDAQGQPELLGPPMTQLKDDIPLRPACMGNLVPQAVNMWMGTASEGASSGLHHDFHDNLYILLRGRKRFRLYPSTDAPNMYTHGVLKRIHSNGRIVYEGQGDVAADGSHPATVRRWQQQLSAEKELEAAEQALKRKEKGAKARLAKAEQALELLLEAQLGAGHLGTGQGCSDDEACSNDSWPAGMQDDYVDSDAEAAADSDDCTPSTEDRALNSMNSMSREPTANPAPVNSKSDSARANKKMKMSDKMTEQKAQEVNSRASEVPGGKWREVTDDSHPDSFSQVDLNRPQQEIETQFPLFPGVHKALECELEAGQMLYLPCGWFHEVRSYGSSQEGGHLALNYWFHPPDQTGPKAGSFLEPYRSQYWAAHWANQDTSN